MNQLPLVTIVVPARNEVHDIGQCIAHIARQDYPANFIEVLVIDGGSTDGTGAEARAAMAAHGIADGYVIDNLDGSTPSNLNLGLGKARGEILCRVDARSYIEAHYVRTCVEVLTASPEVAVVGGAQRAVANDSHPISVGIARALNNRYAMGFSRYRRSTESGAAETVYLGAFRVVDLRVVGGWDQRFPTNQDFDLNRRMAMRGTIWFDGSLVTGYTPRASLRRLFGHYVRFGRAKVRYWRTKGDRPRPRQVALLAAGPAALLCMAAACLLPRRQQAVALALTATGALAVEQAGSIGPEGRLAARLAAVVAMATTSVGWLSGVAAEWVRKP